MDHHPSPPRTRSCRSARLALVAVAAALATAAPASRSAGEPTTAPSTRPAVAPAVAYTETIPGTDVRFEMVPIPGGQFTLGSPPGEPKRRADEGPRVTVDVEPFYMGRYEVTWAEVEPFLARYGDISRRRHDPVPADRLADAVTYPSPMYEIEAGPVLHRMGRTARHPAVYLSQLTARQYTKWLSKKTGRFYRLPTEAEWEYAARAGTKTAFFFGDDPKKLDDYAWHFENSELDDGDPGYHPVGEKKPSPWGLHDIYGNVAEIVFDQYAADWYGGFAGRAVTAADVTHWPTRAWPRVTRGGSWESDPEDCRSAARFQATVKLNAHDPAEPKSPWWLHPGGVTIGFRVVSPAREPPEAEKLRWWDVDNAEDRKTIFEDYRDRQVREIIEPPRPATRPVTRPAR